MLSSLRYRLEWLKIVNSPFKFPKVRFYFGKIRVGTPYFLPRRWYNNHEKPGYLKAVPAWWFKLDVVPLGYKTKWTETDYRHEYDPRLSLVICGLQIAIRFHLDPRVWESWLIYENCTEGVPLNRLRKCRKINPNVWESNGVKTDYFLKGLKKCWYENFE